MPSKCNLCSIIKSLIWFTLFLADLVFKKEILIKLSLLRSLGEDGLGGSSGADGLVGYGSNGGSSDVGRWVGLGGGIVFWLVDEADGENEVREGIIMAEGFDKLGVRFGIFWEGEVIDGIWEDELIGGFWE